jgi:glucose/arabinose dehydrogenase
MCIPFAFARRAGVFLAVLAVLVFTPAAHAALLAYEPFTNTVGAEILGSGGGFGFTNVWQTNSSVGVGTNTSFGLAYTDGGGRQLATNGGAAYFRGNTAASTSMQGYRQFTFSRGTNTTVDGSNTWISFLVARIGATNGGVNPWARGANLDHDFATNVAASTTYQQKLALGGASGAATNSVSLIPQGSGTLLRPSAIAFGGATNFVVVKIEHKTNALDNAFLFINPSLASEPLTNTANTNSLGLFDYSFDRLRIFVGGQSSAAQPFAELIVDEYRVGETFADVAPTNATVTSTATKLLAILPGQTFTSGAAPGGAPDAQTNGTAFNVALYAVNADGVTVDTNYSGAKTIAYSGPANAPDGSAPSYATSVTFTTGSGTAATTLKKSQTISITPTNSTLTGLASSNVTVVVGAATLLQIKTAADGSGATIAAQNVPSLNSLTNFSVTFDAYSNFIANAAVTWTLTNKTGSVVNGDLVAAGDNLSAVFTGHAVGTAQVRADTGALTAASGTLTVTTSIDHYDVTITSPQTAGAAFTATLTARDSLNAVVDNSSTVVNYTTSSATLQFDANGNSTFGESGDAQITLSHGTNTISVRDNKAENSVTVTATDTGSKTGVSSAFNVNAAAAAKLFVTLPGQTFTAFTGNSGSVSAQTAGTSFNLTLTATDANTNIVTSYTGAHTISYTGPGGAPSYTTAVTFTNGQSVVPTTLKKAETTTLTANDGSLTAVASTSVTVNAGAFTQLQTLVPGETAAPGTATGKTGSPNTQFVAASFAATVNAVDTNWNLISTNDTIHLVTSDPSDTEPADAALVAGTKNFTVTPATSGALTVTASDVSNGAITSGTNASITVNSTQPLVRVANTTLAMPAAPPAQSYTFTNAFPGLGFTNPVCIVSPPDETNRIFIVEKRGRIIVITNLAAPTRAMFLNITNLVTAASETTTADEQGLLSLAFHPGYATNGYFYVWYTGADTTSLGSGTHDILARYQVSSTNANVAATNEQRILSQYDRYSNHNGGDLHFGPTDGYLYLSIGDEGNQQGTNGNPQRIDKNFFACMLRLDVDKRVGNLAPNPHSAVVTNASGQPFFSVPIDNPFVHTTLGGDWNGMFNGTNFSSSLTNIHTELWVVGLRNPFRFSFSALDNTLYLGDVGEQDEEEINVIVRGKNYGWNWYDGYNSRTGYAPAGGTPAGFTNTPPINYYTQVFSADKYSVIGGYVYTGTKLSQLYGAYFFADYGKGNVWAMRNVGTNVTFFQQLFTDDFESGLANVSTFGVDPSNLDMLYADLKNGTNGMIKRIVYSTNAPAGTPIPPTLADTGAFSDTTNLTVAAGVVPYDLNVPFWSDNAQKTRWFSVPNTNLDLTFAASNNWSFPTGTVWIKHFELELTNGSPASRTRVETRLLVKNTDGVYGVTYRWGGSLTNATLVGETGYDENFVINDGGGILRTQAWHYPGRAECLQCHTEMGGYALGFNTPELNRNFGYANGTTNQIQAYADAGYFSNAITSPATLLKLAHATNSAYSLEFRARSYFAANCRHCHQGSGIAYWDARIETALADARIVDGALINYLGDATNRVVKANSLANSVLYRRIAQLDENHMPPLATGVLDATNIALIAAWITNGIPTSLTFTTPPLMTTGTVSQATLLGNFSASTNNVTSDAETTYASANASVLTVNTTGLLTASSSSTGAVQVIATFGVISITNTITVLGALPPTITTNPASVTAPAGGATSFTVAAAGDAPLNYFWFKNTSTAIANGTNATLNLSALTTNDSGSTYYCLVSNFVSTVASASATLTVTSVPPAIVYPAAPTIGKGNVAVTLTDYAQAPFSTRTGNVYPPTMNFADQLTRISMMRAEPTNAPLATNRFFVADNNRNLYIVPKTNALSTNAWVKYINFEEVFPTFDNNPGYAGGLTAFAFDPAYATNGIFYTCHMETNNVLLVPTNGALPGFNTNGYTTTTQINPPSGSVTRVAVLVEWTDTNVNNATFEGTAREMLRLGFYQTIHPMGDLLFNPNAQPGDADYRNLYLAIGDGRAGETAGTTHNHPQQLDAFAGKVLRITPDLNLRTNDVLSSNGRYRIPSSGSDQNPFANTNATFTNLTNVKKEIYAYGFRNPHRFSWDATSDKLFVNDIGLNSWEEVNLIRKGTNYGWAEREGPEQMLVSGTPGGVTGSRQTVPLAFPTNDTLTVTGLVSAVTPVYPVAVYCSLDGDAISSGFVYRGTAMPALVGKYVFADITTARLFYCDLAEMIAADDGNRNTVATIRELQVIYNSAKRRLYDVIGDTYTNRGGFVTGQRLPGSSTVALGNDPYGVAYGKGRADVRLALGGDNEIYVISKSDGMIRKMAFASLPPTGGTNVFYCATNQTLKIDAADLLATGSDPENDALSLAAVNLTTTNGVTLATNGSFIFYTNVNFAPDRFTYTLTDTHFGTGTGAVVILPPTISPASDIASVTASFPGSGTNRFSLNFSVSGVAGYQYTFQYATNLPGNPWFTLDTKIFGASGVWQFAETNTTDAARFYRVRWP